MSQQTRPIEYYRLWPGNNGDSGTWDTDIIEIPADTPDDKIEETVRKVRGQIRWREGPPILVSVYSVPVPEEDNWKETEEVLPAAVDIPEQIRAECHSDDRVYSAKFNSLPWFQQADDGDILTLAREDWGDGDAADEIGMFMAELVPDVEKMFDYLEHVNAARKRVTGWVCMVNKADVMAWLKEHRPQLFLRVCKALEREDEDTA